MHFECIAHVFKKKKRLLTFALLGILSIFLLLLLLPWAPKGAGADVRVTTSDGATCLHVAAERGLVDVMQFVLTVQPGMAIDAPTNDGYTALHLAAGQYSTPAIEYLADKGASLDARLPDCGSTPLMVAARRGLEKNVLALLRLGADADAHGTAAVYKQTALHLAARQPNAKVIEALVDQVPPRLPFLSFVCFFVFVK